MLAHLLAIQWVYSNWDEQLDLGLWKIHFSSSLTSTTKNIAKPTEVLLKCGGTKPSLSQGMNLSCAVHIFRKAHICFKNGASYKRIPVTLGTSYICLLHKHNKIRSGSSQGKKYLEIQFWVILPLRSTKHHDTINKLSEFFGTLYQEKQGKR